jgi:hypothetical protein
MGLFSTKTKTSSSNEPWKPFSDYLRGTRRKSPEDNPGLPALGWDQYQRSGFTPEMQGGVDWYTNMMRQNGGNQGAYDFANNGFDFLKNASGNVAKGAYDSNFDPMSYINMGDERASLGELDPTEAFKRLLSGRPDTGYLDQESAAMMKNAGRNLSENVLPGLRSGGVVSGQYGGSRQGLGEGLAMSRMNQDMAPAIANMYSQALENAQQRMMGTSQYLNDNAYNTAMGNRNIGFQNNSQTMQRNAGNLNNRMQALPIAQGGFGLLNGARDMYGSNFQNYMNALGMPGQYDWQNMNNYANLMYGGAGVGGSSQGKNSQSAGAGNVALGLGSMALGAYGGFGGFGPSQPTNMSQL